MHPGMIPWLRARRARREAFVQAGCGHGGGGHDDGHRGWRAASGYGDIGGGSFGVRRPLRFLARRLDLDERQTEALARIVADLKTERAQAEVDDRRTIAAFADAVADAEFDAARAKEGAGLRVDAATRLRDAVVDALGAIHALLDDDQRKELAYLIRTGTLSL